MFVPNLEYGDVVRNDDIVNIFGCSPQGGMRLSTRTNTLVLVCKHVNNPYEDEWYGDVLLYTGMGRVGNQTLEGNQNKTLYYTYTMPNSSSPSVVLFEVYREGEYTYRGMVEVADKPYKGKQLDDLGKMRDVWIFPLKLLGTNPSLPDYSNIKRGMGRSKPREDLRPAAKVEPKKTIEQCCYANSITGFFNETKESWISTMNGVLSTLPEKDVGKMNPELWEEMYDILKSDLIEIANERPEFNILFEYRLPYGFGRRPDVILVSNEQEIIIDFSNKSNDLKRHIDLINDYFKDLTEFHPLSKGKALNAILYHNNPTMSSSKIQICKPGEGKEAINKILKETTTRNDIEKWIRSKK